MTPRLHYLFAEFAWGYGIEPQAPRVKGINLLLGSDDADSRAFLPPGVSAMDVTTDFLSSLYQHAIATLWMQDPYPMQILKLNFVLTVRADWSGADRQHVVLFVSPGPPVAGEGDEWKRRLIGQ